MIQAKGAILNVLIQNCWFQMVPTILNQNIQDGHFSLDYFVYRNNFLFVFKMTQAKVAILNSSVFEWWFENRTIRKPNFKMFGIGMVFGIPSSDFEPPLQSDFKRYWNRRPIFRPDLNGELNTRRKCPFYKYQTIKSLVFR